MLSEFPNFPINPSNTTIENCIEAINSSADIFVLIIGNRYGYTLESGKSITNVEFVTAKNKGIPIYVFISKQIISILPVYLNNKSADYSYVVDNAQIFEFANDVRNSSGLWSFEFNNFQDIIVTLKTQLSFLFKDSLLLRNKFYNNTDQAFYLKLSNKALKVLYLKERIYEFEYMAQVFVDEITKYEVLTNDYKYKIILKSNHHLKDDQEFLDWASNRIYELIAFTPTLDNLINVLLPKYLNELGKPADLKGLYYVANTYARVYQSFINWAIDTLSVEVDEKHKEIRNIIAELTSKSIERIWEFPFTMQERIAEAKTRFQLGEKNVFINLNIKLEVDPDVMKRYMDAMEILKEDII